MPFSLGKMPADHGNILVPVPRQNFLEPEMANAQVKLDTHGGPDLGRIGFGHAMTVV